MKQAMPQRQRSWIIGLLICGLGLALSPAAAQQAGDTEARTIDLPKIAPATLGAEPLRLEPLKASRAATHSRRSWRDTLPHTTGQLAIVLGIFAGLVSIWRLSKGRDTALPVDLVEVYGKVPMTGKQSLHLVRIGGRLLVLIESAQGMQRLAEISDPDEVRSVVERLGKGHLRRLPASLQNLVGDRHLSSFRTG